MKGPAPGIDPAAAREAIAREADRLGLAIPEGALEALALHLHLLYAWNRRINLTAIRDPAEGIRLHVLESLAALEWLDEILEAAPVEPSPLLADLGSGNGYPALPLLAARPALRGRLHERVARKADFLRAVLRKTGMNSRVEVVEANFTGVFPERPAVVTLRAFPEPGSTIARVLADAPPTESRSARRPSVLAWLSRDDANRIAERISRLPGVLVRTRSLPTRPAASLLFARPREA